MIIHSDWHIHSEFSYDATLPLETIAETANAQGLRYIGITDHLNWNDQKFFGDLHASARGVKEARKKYPNMILGVELTPVPQPEIDFIAKHGTRDGYEPPVQDGPYGIGLAATKEELMACGVRFAIGASHWRVDIHNGSRFHDDPETCIREWHRQQMALATDGRVTILGHPWYIDKALWYEDFSVIPHSMNLEMGAALKETGKYLECNSHFFCSRRATEKFRHQYAEFLRELFETGVPVLYGSDAHTAYPDARPTVEKYLTAAGFVDGDFAELAEDALW